MERGVGLSGCVAAPVTVGIGIDARTVAEHADR